jgi:hypothetical protein
MNSSRLVWLSAALAVVAAFCLLPAPAYAQKDAGAKARGEHSVPFWSSRSSSRHLTAARDYARDFQAHVAVNPKPEPAVVKEVTKEIGNSLDEAKKHLAQLKKEFAGNKDAVAGIDSIDKQLTAAFDHHKTLCECCEKEAFDAIATMACCKDLAGELDKILDQHEALMQKLAPKAAPAPAAKKKAK